MEVALDLDGMGMSAPATAPILANFGTGCREGEAMAKTRIELDAMLDELERDLEMLVMDTPDFDDLWTVFAGQADAIEASAGPHDIAHVRLRTLAILASQGILPPEET